MEDIKKLELELEDALIERFKMEEQVVMAKRNLGEALNLAFELGGSDLIDKIEERLSLAEK